MLFETLETALDGPSPVQRYDETATGLAVGGAPSTRLSVVAACLVSGLAGWDRM